MLKLFLSLFILLSYSSLSQADDLTCKFYTGPTQYLNNIGGDASRNYRRIYRVRSCANDRISGYIHEQSKVTKVKTEISIFVGDKRDFLGTINIPLTLPECESLKCYDKANLNNLIKSDPRFKEVKQKVEALAQEKNYSPDELWTKDPIGRQFIKSADLNKKTPLFKDPANPDINLNEYNLADVTIGNLDDEDPADATFEYADMITITEADLPALAAKNSAQSFDGEDEWVSAFPEYAEEEIASEDEDYEITPASTEEISSEAGVLIAEVLAIPKKFNETIIVDNPAPKLGEQKEQTPLETFSVGEEMAQARSMHQDNSKVTEQNEGKNSTNEEIYQINTPEKDWTITVIDSGPQFKINDGQSTYNLSSDMLALITAEPDIVTNIRVDGDNLFYKIEGFDDEIALNDEPAEISTPLITDCIEQLKDFVGNNQNNETLKKFLGIQGNLTLHRLAWAQLNQGLPQKKLEDSIIKLMKEKYGDEYKDIAKKFDKSPARSRNFLAKAIPLVQDILNAQTELAETQKVPFLLNSGDLKMLEIIASFEGERNGQHDARMWSSDSIGNSIINMTTIINSSYINSNHALKSEEQITSNKNELMTLLPLYEKKLKDQLQNIVYSACFSQDSGSCVENNKKASELVQQDFEVLMGELMDSALQRSDAEIMQSNKYKSYWLNVAK